MCRLERIRGSPLRIRRVTAQQMGISVRDRWQFALPDARGETERPIASLLNPRRRIVGTGGQFLHDQRVSAVLLFQPNTFTAATR
jgi:hypothetical protein